MFFNELCDCESMGGRLGAHREECPTMQARRKQEVREFLTSLRDAADMPMHHAADIDQFLTEGMPE